MAQPQIPCRRLLFALAIVLGPAFAVAQEPALEPAAAQDSASTEASPTNGAPANDATSEKAPLERAPLEKAPLEQAPPKQPPLKNAALKQAAATAPVRFAFEGAPWREVIEWLAAEADLALHINELPTGSLTYADPADYSHQEAIDRVNLFLLPQGFTLVRSGRLLSVINLADPRSAQQLNSLAKLVRVEDLEKLESHEVVRCFFALGDIAAEDAVQELTPLNLMSSPAVFARTNQLLIVDTATKLRNVKTVLDGFKPSLLTNGTIVRSFTLKHAEAEDILTVARPHLGLATGEMIGIDVSLSADLRNRNIFVTGVEDKVKLIENLIEALDKPDDSLSVKDGAMKLRSHPVQGGNVETVYNVLQTLLAGKTVRMSMDEAAGTIVVLATPETQREIEETVAQLQAAEPDFEVIPLKEVDPYLAVTLLEQMLDLPGPLDDPEDIDPDAPKIDADPDNMRLFVRAKRAQIEQIKKIVAGLDVKTVAGDESGLRMLPLRGKQAVLVLETAAKFWRGDNPILLIGSIAVEPAATERVVNDPQTGTTPQRPVKPPTARLLSKSRTSQGAPIQCQLTPRGVLMQSDDEDALDKFEQHLRTIAGPLASIPSPPVVFYLKHTRPDDALRMLAELLDGADSVSDGESGSLVNGYVPSDSSLFGSFVTSRDGATTLTSGDITVVADTRLNRLIAQGTAADIDRIEQYLKIVDKDASITDVQTYGSSHIIELKHTRAGEVAATLREAYAQRLAGTSAAAAPQGKSQPQPQPNSGANQPARGETETKRGNDAGAKAQPAAKRAAPKSAPARNLEPRMTIAVHDASNSLIVTAPEPLFREVEQLARLIDSRGRRAVEVIGPINSAAVETLLQDVFGSGGGGGSRRSSPTPRAPSARPSPTRPSASSAVPYQPGRGKPTR